VPISEDANLLRLADLPVTREVDRISGATRSLDSARLQRALQSEARQLRYELTRIRRATSLRSTVRVVRGQVLNEALAASVSVDVTFVHGTRRGLPGEQLPSTLLRRGRTLPAPGSRRPSRAGKPVWTLFEGGPADVRAIQVAAKIARSLGGGLMVLLPYRGADEAERAKREARAVVDQVDLRFLEVAENRALLQERILTPGSSSLLVIAKQSQELEDSVTRSFLESLAVPLVLVA
jgi:hypothetical protein